jgi:hypothetical protein
MVEQQRFQSAANCILSKSENHEENIQGGQFNCEIPDGLRKEEKQKEQKHPRVSSKEKKETNHGAIHLPVAVLKYGRHVTGESRPRALFQTHETGTQLLLFEDITEMELEQKFLEKMSAPRNCFKLSSQIGRYFE